MKYIIKKLITLIITLLFITLITFTAFSVIPGDAAAARLGTNATPEQVEALREEMGLNDPLPQRYVNWLSGAIRGDFGDSYQYDTSTVASLLADRLPVTGILAVLSLVIIVVIAIPLGILSARYAGKWLDTLINQLSQVTMAVPAFFSRDPSNLHFRPDFVMVSAGSLCGAFGKLLGVCIVSGLSGHCCGAA